MPEIQIERLQTGLPGISPTYGATLAEACIVSLSRSNHSTGVQLSVDGMAQNRYSLLWDGAFNDQLDRTWKDQEEATELGAVCLAVQLALELTDYTVIERSVKTTGFDYWLGRESDSDDDLLFEKKARLEISGIFNGSASKVNTRYKGKVKQTKQSDSTQLPAYVAIVEFGNPTAKFGIRQ